jgi:excisionase family DNA binding protein
MSVEVENMEPLLNMDEAAALLKLTKQQLYELCRSRSRSRQEQPIPFVKLGKRRLFRASSLNEWVSKLELA